jgi:hypothetical protein
MARVAGAAKAMCVICLQRVINRPKKLCSACYAIPAVRRRLKVNFGPLGMKVPTKEPKPTQALPGSEEKIQVLMARVEAGEILFHKDDACERVPSWLARGRSLVRDRM